MMNEYPKITYGSDILTDISRRFIIENIKTSSSEDIYFDYLIKNWKSPENLAYDFYGSCDYVWAILIINNIVNPFEDWLLSDSEIKERIKSKYPNTMYDIHHYEKNGIIYAKEVDGAIPITNYDYEMDKNEKKRKIKVIYPEIVKNMEQSIKSVFVL